MSALFKSKTKRFGEIAVGKGLATDKEIGKALKQQREFNEKDRIHKEIGLILTENGVLTPNDVKSILDEQQGQIGIMAWFIALFRLSH